MPWTNNLGPDPFDPDAAVALADFGQAEYVTTYNAPPSQTANQTRKAYKFVTYVSANGTWRICVVADIHIIAGVFTAGHTWIPGWENWQAQTTAANLATVSGLADVGAFPGASRYPQLQPPITDNWQEDKDDPDFNAPLAFQAQSTPPPPKPLPLTPPSTSTAQGNRPIAKYFVFNETGNILIASTVDGKTAISQAAQDLFQEVSVFFAALTKALSKTPRDGVSNPTNFMDYYTLYDYEPMEAIIQQSGMFITMNREDYIFTESAGSATFNTDLIASVLGFAVTDGADIAALTNVLRSMGKQAVVSYNRTGKHTKMGHLTFICEYLLGMPMVSVEYYSIDEDQVSMVVNVGPCISTTTQSINLAIHKDTFMFVPPAWIAKYSGDLGSVADNAQFQQLVSELAAYASGAPVVVSVKDSTQADIGPSADNIVATLTSGSSYAIEGINFGAPASTFAGTVSIGGVAQTVTQNGWTDTSITFTAVKSAVAGQTATGPVVVGLGDAAKTVVSGTTIYSVA